MKRYQLITGMLLLACSRGTPGADLYMETTFILRTAELPSTRAGKPDETRITDYNIFIFNSFGDLEECAFLRGNPLEYHTRLLRDVPYTLVAAANLGYQLPIQCLADAQAYRYPMAYPDEYREGIPMAAVWENRPVQEQTVLRVERLMARIDIRLDRTQLEEGVLMKVTDVCISNCPSSVTLFPGSRVESASQVFRQGFSLGKEEVEALNRDQADGLSGTASLYLLENSGETHRSYVELKAAYHDDHFHTAPGEPLVYRIPLENVVRNTVYPLVITLSGMPSTPSPYLR